MNYNSRHVVALDRAAMMRQNASVSGDQRGAEFWRVCARHYVRTARCIRLDQQFDEWLANYGSISDVASLRAYGNALDDPEEQRLDAWK